MTSKASLTTELISRTESYDGIRAGIVRLEDVLKGYSYQVVPEIEDRKTNADEVSVNWPAEFQSVLVWGLYHPEDNPKLDWWERGNSLGNRRLMDISESLKHWLWREYKRRSLPLPYHLEKGGIFLKDAAVFSGIGIIGRNNLLLHPDWGPKIRLRSLLIEGNLQPTEGLEGFSPCETCDEPCQKACPVNAFPQEQYSRLICHTQIKANVDNKIPDGEIKENGKPNFVVKYCRACEFACPVGA